MPARYPPGQAPLERLPLELKTQIAALVGAEDRDDGSPYRADLTSPVYDFGPYTFEPGRALNNRYRRQRFFKNLTYKSVSEKQELLQNLVLSSRYLSDATKGVLYRNPVVRGKGKMHALLVSLVQFPDNRKLIRSLDLTGVEWAPPDAAKLSGWRRYPIKQLVALLHRTPDLRRLAIEAPADWKINEGGLAKADRPPKIAEFVGAFSDLIGDTSFCKSLNEISLSVPPGHVLDPLNFAPPFRLGKVTKLEIAGPMFPHPVGGRHVIPDAPTALASIQELSLQSGLGLNAGYTALIDMFRFLPTNNIKVIRVGPDFDRNFHDVFNSWNTIFPTQAKNLESFEMEPTECDDRCELGGCTLRYHAKRRFGPEKRLTCLSQMTSLTALKIPFRALFGYHLDKQYNHLEYEDTADTVEVAEVVELPPALRTLHLIEEHETKYSRLPAHQRRKKRETEGPDSDWARDHDICAYSPSSFLGLEAFAGRCAKGDFPSLMRVHLELRRCRWEAWEIEDFETLERSFAKGGVCFTHDPIPDHLEWNAMKCPNR